MVYLTGKSLPAANVEIEQLSSNDSLTMRKAGGGTVPATISAVSFLQGSVLLEAMRSFENALGVYVKAQMKEHFPDGYCTNTRAFTC